MPQRFRPSKAERIGQAISQGAQQVTNAFLDVERLKQNAQAMQEQGRQFNERLQLEREKFDAERDENTKARNLLNLNKADQFIERGLNLKDAKARKVYFERNAEYIKNAYQAMDPNLDPSIDQLIAGGDAVREAHRNIMRVNFQPFQRARKLSNKELDNFIEAFSIIGANPVEAQNAAFKAVEEDRKQLESEQFNIAAKGGPIGGEVLKKEGAGSLQLEAQPAEGGGFALQPQPEKSGRGGASGLGEAALKGVTGNLQLIRSQSGIEDQLNNLEQEYKRTKNPLNKPGPLQGRVNNILNAFGVSTDNYVKFRSLANQGALERIKTLSGVQYTDKQLKYLASALPSELRTPDQIRSMSKAMKQVAIGGLVDNLQGAALGGQFAEPSTLARVLSDNANQIEVGPLVKAADVKNLINNAAWNSQEELNQFVSSLPPATIKALKSGK